MFVSVLTGAGKSSTFELSRIFRTPFSFLSAQFRHKMFVKSEPSPLDIYLLSGNLLKIQTSFGQFSFKMFLHNHF